MSEEKKERLGIPVSGFVRLVRVSEEVSTLLGLEGRVLNRRDLFVAFCRYLRNKNLQDPQNTKNFVPDEKLRSLLGVQESTEVSKGMMILNRQVVRVSD